MPILNEKIIETAGKFCPDLTYESHRDQLSLNIPAEKLLDVAAELRSNPSTSFDMLTDITAIDWLKPKGTAQSRFEVVYFLYSNKYKANLRLKVPVDEDNCRCPSVIPVWKSANWYERETYDMYGIKFDEHPDLRRFYMPEGFADPETGEPLYPLRKDYPLMGIPDSLPLPPYPERYGEPT